MSIGCFIIAIVLVAVLVVGGLISAVLAVLNKLGATTVWLWESLLNLFRFNKKEVINPWTGKNNFDKSTRQDDEVTYRPTEQRPKRYDSTDGEYIDYTDV